MNAPETIRVLFDHIQPVGPKITPLFQYENGMESFLKNEADILFALKDEVRQIPGVTTHPLFESRIYLIAGTNDPLAGKNLITEEDLYGPGFLKRPQRPVCLDPVRLQRKDFL